MASLDLCECNYCGTRLLPAALPDHLLDAHSHLLFHCDECETYVDRKDFILHMSLHAVQYDVGERTRRATESAHSAPENTGEVTIEAPSVSPRRENQELNKKEPHFEKKTENVKETNEFSDHSDVEFEFDPLPESVFDAIEDSQEPPPPAPPPNPAPVEQPAPCAVPDFTPDPIIDVQKNIEKPKPETLNYKKSLNETDTTREKSKRHRKLRSCPTCGKSYTASSSYFYHVKYSHDTRRDFKCNQCDKAFKSKALLSEHAAVHSEQRALACATCGKAFRSRAALYIHAQTHGADKRYRCTHCSAAFRWRAGLARHAARHVATAAGDGFQCSSCLRTFAVRADLLRHARTHKPHALACQHCGKLFAQKRYLKVHLHKKHAATLQNNVKENITTEIKLPS